MPRSAKATPRRRLDAEAARKLILDVTEKRLARVGPSGIRLQEVAHDAEVSHSTVLHHFGSREQLVKAVIARSLVELHASLIEALSTPSNDSDALLTQMEKVAATLERTGHARVLVWLALEGQSIDDPNVRLSNVLDAAHAMRLGRVKRGKKPTREDTAFGVMMTALTMTAGTVFAPLLLKSAGLPGDAATKQRFRSWMMSFIVKHMDEMMLD
jgi:AcrR family transcriptional regulator